MPVDSTNYGREIKNLRAEIADLRTEVAFMHSALQNIQEQFGFALAEIANSIKNLSSEIQNSADKNFSLLREEMTIMDRNFNRKITENISATDSVNENFSRIEKISETQKLNFRNYFDKIDNSLVAQQKMFGEVFNQQSADIEKKFNTVEEIVQSSQKNLLKKLNAKTNQDLIKNLSAIENLLRLIAANQMLGEVEKNFNKKKSLPNVSSSRKKKIFIYGRSKVGKSTLEELLLKRFNNLEITETKAIERYEVEVKPNADLVIYVITNSSIDSNEIKRFNKIYRANKNILMIVNAKLLYDMDKRIEIARSQVKIQMSDTLSLDNVSKNFLYNVGLYDWSKIPVIKLNLKAALRGLRSDDKLFEFSNFEAIEKFINSI